MSTNNPKILVVEDNEIASLQIRKIFEKQGYHVDVAMNGMEAMEKLMSDAYDIMLTDLAMPVVNGQQLIEAVKRNEYDKMKIFVVTAYSGEQTVKEMFNLGVDDYITKPYNTRDLLQRVQKLLM
jgi:DNA-binding response OmpR family regulator